MDYLDWYLSLEKKHNEHQEHQKTDLQKGYELGLLVCPNSETVKRRIIPTAVEIACKSARNQDRRKKMSEKNWKIHFSNAQLFQIAILEAIHNNARQSESTSRRSLACYIGFLALCTLQRNSFFVAVGFERILNNGSTKEILELYSKLFSAGPSQPESNRDEKSVNDISKIIHKEIYESFKSIFQTEGQKQKLRLDEIPKGDNHVDKEIYRILDEMIPWGTDHVAETYAQRTPLQMGDRSIAHVCIDQRECLKLAKCWDTHLSTAFDKWKVPVLRNGELLGPADDAGGPQPWSAEIKEEIMKEILWLQEKSKRGLGSTFEVLVDGEVKHSINRSEKRSVKISLPYSARYVEMRDQETKVMVANCHLIDPREVSKNGWKSSVGLPCRGRITFQFLPELDQDDDQAAGLSMKVSVRAEEPWWTSVRKWGIEFFERWSALLTTRKALVASVGLNLVLGAVLVFQFGRSWERRATLYEEARAAIEQVFRDASHLRMEMDTASGQEVENTVQQIRIIPAVASGNTYPVPFLGNQQPNAFVLAQGLEEFPDLKTDYDAALRTWSAMLGELGDLLMEKSKVNEAIQVFEYVRARASSADFGVLYALGELYKLRGQHDKAIGLYKEMAGLLKDDPRPWNYAGWSLFKLGRYEEALRAYQEGIVAFQRSAAAYRVLGRSPYENYAKLLLNIALVHRETGRNREFEEHLKGALDLSLKAFQREDENNPRITFTLAVIYGYSGEWNSALRYLELACNKAQGYVVRAENEEAFQNVLKDSKHPYHKRFVELIESRRPPAEGRFGPRLESNFDPARFSE